MKDTPLPFPQTLDIPQEDFELFVGLNSNTYAEKQRFYVLKDAILRRFGRVDGYDLQTITKICWTCNGTGKYPYKDERCYHCNNGIYAKFNVCLQRYVLNDRLFHKPTDTPLGQCAGKIEGIIEHKHVDSFNCTRALDVLMEKYADLMPKLKTMRDIIAEKQAQHGDDMENWWDGEGDDELPF